MFKTIKWMIVIVMIIVILLMIRVIVTTRVVADEQIEINIELNEDSISGTLYTPKAKSYPVVVFVHGDGAVDRTGSDNYYMIMNAFLRKGVACFSYDKLGVGNSSGNWLNQSMADRADEVEAVIDSIRLLNGVTHVGVIGFSQGDGLFQNLPLKMFIWILALSIVVLLIGWNKVGLCRI